RFSTLFLGSAYNPSAQAIRQGNAYVSVDLDRNPASPYYNYLYEVTADYDQPALSSGATYSDTDVFLRRSTDFGVTWSDRVRIDDDPTTSFATQFLPQVAVDPGDGSVNVIWYDTRDQPPP